MKLTPYTKKVEIYVGYKGFYSVGDEKITITVEDNGVGALVDTRSGIPASEGVLMKYFKPMASLDEAKKFVEAELQETKSAELEKLGFVKLKVIKT